MAQEAAVPKGFWARVQKMIDDSIAAYARSGPLRNATISGGAGLKITDGGQLALVAKDGTVLFYVGPLGPALANGTIQQGWSVRRADGTSVLSLYDSDVSDGVIRQALNWWDRSGNAVIADDTDGGQGIARPYLPTPFYPVRYADMSVSSTSSTFETVFRATLYKQQPKLYVGLQASMDTSGTAGEVQVVVNGTPVSPAQSVGFAVTSYAFGPAAVTGAHMSTIYVDIQARRTSASGAIRVVPQLAYGIQT